MNQPGPLRISDQTSWEAPDPVWWAQQGYAVINLDTRGGGHSEGRGDLLSDQEADDISQVIEWAADQPWSNGRVGMLGVSYLAISQYKVAGLDPPALKAICPWEGFTDAYRDFFTPGGVVEDGFARVWLFVTNRSRASTRTSAENAEAPAARRLVGGADPRPVEDPVPMLVCTSFSDTNLHSVGSMRAFQQRARAKARLHPPRPEVGDVLRRDGPRRSSRFSTGTSGRDVPDCRRCASRSATGPTTWSRSETSRNGPCPHRVAPAVPGADGGLGEPRPARPGHLRPAARRSRVRARFDQDTELTGPMTLRLRVAVTGTTTPACSSGSRSGPRAHPSRSTGRTATDATASPKVDSASPFASRPQRSSPHQPEHTFRTLQAVPDDEQLEVVIPLSSSATLFHTGREPAPHGRRPIPPTPQPLLRALPRPLPTEQQGKATILWTPDQPSSLEIPVIPRNSNNS